MSSNKYVPEKNRWEGNIWEFSPQLVSEGLVAVALIRVAPNIHVIALERSSLISEV